MDTVNMQTMISDLRAKLAESEARNARLINALKLLRGWPADRLAYLKEKSAKIGRDYGAETCVDDYWRKLIIDEALADAPPVDEVGKP